MTSWNLKLILDSSKKLDAWNGFGVGEVIELTIVDGSESSVFDSVVSFWVSATRSLPVGLSKEASLLVARVIDGIW